MAWRNEHRIVWARLNKGSGMQTNNDAAQPSISSTHCRFGDLRYFTNDGPIGDSLREYGEWAQVEIDFLTEFTPTGSTVVDVGAFIGTHALAFSDAVGPDGAVYAVEPQPQAFGLLADNVARNSATNVTVLNVAAGAHAGETHTALFPPTRRFNGGLSAMSDSDSADTSGVPVQSIDALRLGACDLVKIDVNGAEEGVFAGMTEVIQTLKPIIYCALNDTWRLRRVHEMKIFAGWSFYLVRTSAFNPRNIFGNRINFFGDAQETGILLTAPDVAVEERLGLHLDVIRIESAAGLEELMDSTPRFGVEMDAEIERERLQSRMYTLSSEVEGLRFANASLHRTIRESTELASRVRHEYESSRSWKVTRILRMAGNLVRRVVKRRAR